MSHIPSAPPAGALTARSLTNGITVILREDSQRASRRSVRTADAQKAAKDITRAIDVSPADGLITRDEAATLLTTKRGEVDAILKRHGSHVSARELVLKLLTAGWDVPATGLVAAQASVINALEGLGYKTLTRLWRVAYRAADSLDHAVEKLGVKRS